MNMIEKVAQAIRDNVAAALPDGVNVDYQYAAIAAIEAMQDTDALYNEIPILFEGDEITGRATFSGDSGAWLSLWNKTIDAILHEGGDASDSADLPIGS